MASVYLARHRVHGGFCAVKVLAEQLASQPPLVKSFLAEARASASLDEHPNIVNIVDIDEHAGLYYMIMKYIEGEDLSTYLTRKRIIDWKQAAYIAAEVAEALAWSHARGVIHRDMKPSNIRLNRRGGVIVMDFGIAKVGQTPSSFTEMGTRAGTPHYMAPEQIKGDPVDQRSDLYSLGVILYQMATGTLPFRGSNPSMIWQAHLLEEPENPQALEPSIPDPLNHILITLLAKEPNQRYDTAARLVRHLRSLGLEGVAATLDPIDQLDLDHLRTREIRARSIGKPLHEEPPPAITETAQTSERAEIDQTDVAPSSASSSEGTLPLPALKSTPRPPDTDVFQVTPSEGGGKRWIIAAALAVAIGIGAFFALRPSKPPQATTPPVSEAPAADAEEAPPPPEAAQETPAATPEPAPPAAPAKAEASSAPKPPPKAAKPNTGAIYFRTTPSGASIQVDSRPDWSCTSPCWLESLTPGAHAVTARLAGFKVGVVRVEVAAGGREPLSIELQADLISAMIASTPPGADIYIDGQKQAQKTNARIPLAPGTYNVRVVLPGVAEGEQALVVSESQMPFASFQLQAK